MRTDSDGGGEEGPEDGEQDALAMNLAKILGTKPKKKSKTAKVEKNKKLPMSGGKPKKSIVSPIEAIPEEEEADYEERPAHAEEMPFRHRAATLVDIEMEADSDLDDFEENN